MIRTIPRLFLYSNQNVSFVEELKLSDLLSYLLEYLVSFHKKTRLFLIYFFTFFHTFHERDNLKEDASQKTKTWIWKFFNIFLTPSFFLRYKYKVQLPIEMILILSHDSSVNTGRVVSTEEWIFIFHILPDAQNIAN